MTDRPRPSATATAHDRAQDLLIVAQNAANARDAKAMAEALAASGYLDGLVRRLERRWPNLPREDVEDCIGEAVNGAFEAVSAGRTVSQSLYVYRILKSFVLQRGGFGGRWQPKGCWRRRAATAPSSEPAGDGNWSAHRTWPRRASARARV